MSNLLYQKGKKYENKKYTKNFPCITPCGSHDFLHGIHIWNCRGGRKAKS